MTVKKFKLWQSVLSYHIRQLEVDTWGQADGAYLTHQQFYSLLTRTLQSAGIDNKRYTTHSTVLWQPPPQRDLQSKIAWPVEEQSMNSISSCLLDIVTTWLHDATLPNSSHIHDDKKCCSCVNISTTLLW